MSNCVEEILEQYLEFEIVKDDKHKGCSDNLRLEYDNDVKYYLEQGFPKEEALYADTVISFWTIYKRLLEIEAKWNAYRTRKSLESLLRQIKSKQKNDFTSKIISLNDKISDFAEIVYSKGNYMLLPNRNMNIKRYRIAEDRIDVTLFQSFSGGKLSCYFENDEVLRQWILKERFVFLFSDKIVERDHLIWFANNQKVISEMNKQEIYGYIDYAINLIKNRAK